MAKSRLVQRIAEERIEDLYKAALERFNAADQESISLGRRYIKRAKEISMHYKVPLSKRIKGSVCKECGNLMIPGVNCKVIIASSKGYIINRCVCGGENHIIYKQRRSS